MLLLASLGRHQICSSVKDSTQLLSRGQYCSSSLWREKLRNSELRFESKVWFIVRHVPEKNLYIPESPPRSECGLSFLRVDRFDRPGRQKRICRGAPARTTRSTCRSSVRLRSSALIQKDAKARRNRPRWRVQRRSSCRL